jgi:hypothetical protein
MAVISGFDYFRKYLRPIVAMEKKA